MATRTRKSISVTTTHLWEYSEAAAKAMSDTFYACWREFREQHPDKFTPEAILYN